MFQSTNLAMLNLAITFEEPFTLPHNLRIFGAQDSPVEESVRIV